MKIANEANQQNRCYLRGLTPLGLFNTVWGCLFNRVLVKVHDVETGTTVKWYWDTATNWPQQPAVNEWKNKYNVLHDALKQAAEASIGPSPGPQPWLCEICWQGLDKNKKGHRADCPFTILDKDQ